MNERNIQKKQRTSRWSIVDAESIVSRRQGSEAQHNQIDDSVEDWRCCHRPGSWIASAELTELLFEFSVVHTSPDTAGFGHSSSLRTQYHPNASNVFWVACCIDYLSGSPTGVNGRVHGEVQVQDTTGSGKCRATLR